MFLDVLRAFITGFIACMGFLILFRIPRKQFFLAAILASLAWVLYFLLNHYLQSPVIATFLGSLFAALSARFLSFYRKVPQTVFLIPGVILMVPGSTLYYTLYGFIYGDTVLAYASAMQTLKIAAAIALAIAVAAAIPDRFIHKIMPKQKTSAS